MTHVALAVVVTAKNEAASLPACLDSLQIAARHLEAMRGSRVTLVVVADDCRDATVDVAAARGATVLRSTGGKVEAQRAGWTYLEEHLPARPFTVFSDADILADADVLEGLAAAMDDPDVLAAAPTKLPLPPRRNTVLARALHTYNARQGFATKRTWFSGKLFAIRSWHVPDAAEIRRRAARLPEDAFLRLDEPMRVDDVFLSRWVVDRGGTRALAAAPARIAYRAPETLLGMIHAYRRMQRELERVDRLFPELAATGARHGHRRYDDLPTRLDRSAFDLAIFGAALACCKVAYRAERKVSRALGVALDPWPPIRETKLG